MGTEKRILRVRLDIEIIDDQFETTPGNKCPEAAIVQQEPNEEGVKVPDNQKEKENEVTVQNEPRPEWFSEVHGKIVREKYEWIREIAEKNRAARGASEF